MIFGRAQYALFAIPGVLNLLGMFYVMMGAAFRPGSTGMLVTGGLLFLFTAAVFGFSAGARGRDLGWPVTTTGIGMTILIGTGPMVLLPWGVVWIGTLLGRP